MANKEKSKDTPYRERTDTEPHRQTGNIDNRNNNVNTDAVSANEPNVENANDTGIGDTGLNDDKLTNYTQNHSSDA